MKVKNDFMLCNQMVIRNHIRSTSHFITSQMIIQKFFKENLEFHSVKPLI